MDGMETTWALSVVCPLIPPIRFHFHKARWRDVRKRRLSVPRPSAPSPATCGVGSQIEATEFQPKCLNVLIGPAN